MITVYTLDPQGLLIDAVQVSLWDRLPTPCTSTPPPKLTATKAAQWTGSEWRVITQAQANKLREAQPDPAPTLPPDPKLAGVLFEGVMCSATRDDQAGLMAVLLAHQMQGAAFKPTVFYFENGNQLVLTRENIPVFTPVWMAFRQSFFLAKDASP
jgi:hypothetical protein